MLIFLFLLPFFPLLNLSLRLLIILPFLNPYFFIYVLEAIGKECVGNNNKASSKDDVDNNYIVIQIAIATLNNTSDWS